MTSVAKLDHIIVDSTPHHTQWIAAAGISTLSQPQAEQHPSAVAQQADFATQQHAHQQQHQAQLQQQHDQQAHMQQQQQQQRQQQQLQLQQHHSPTQQQQREQMQQAAHAQPQEHSAAQQLQQQQQQQQQEPALEQRSSSLSQLWCASVLYNVHVANLGHLQNMCISFCWQVKDALVQWRFSEISFSH